MNRNNERRDCIYGLGTSSAMEDIINDGDWDHGSQVDAERTLELPRTTTN